MKVTQFIHAVEIPFQIPVAPEMNLDRVVFAYVISKKGITLIDTGVAGAESVIFDHIEKAGRDPLDISTLILTHAHPDHIGSARAIKDTTNCRVLCHPAEQAWVEDIERQGRERPVPGFDRLVEGSVAVDAVLQDGDLLEIEDGIRLRAIHTPGHSAGSVSLLFESEKVLFSGDALPVPGDLPLYDDISASVSSMNSLKMLRKVEVLLSSWEPAIRGRDQIDRRIESGLAYLRKIHNTVLKTYEENKSTGMSLCKEVVANLGLPPFVVNPLLVKAFMSSLEARNDRDLFEP